jgi:hypothetical protein
MLDERISNAVHRTVYAFELRVRNTFDVLFGYILMQSHHIFVGDFLETIHDQWMRSDTFYIPQVIVDPEDFTIDKRSKCYNTI